MKARLHVYQSITGCSGCPMQQPDASFATRWAGVIVLSLGNADLGAKGGGQG